MAVKEERENERGDARYALRNQISDVYRHTERRDEGRR